jgi:1A family penicillin-binding protein
MLRRKRRYLGRSGRKPALLRAPILIANAFLVIFLSLFVVGTASAVGIYFYYAKDLTPPETIATREVALSTKIYDRNGVLLNEIFDPRGGRRTMVHLSDISKSLIDATIATEDANFYTNSGINLRGLTRAVVQTVTGQQLQGGSSITQQLVKQVLIPEEERMQRSISRKIKEVILSFELTRRFSKDQILEWYLNENPYGNLSYGIESAAEGYFGKPARDLDLAESAMLAGLPQAPGYYSPLENFDRAKSRQSDVLDLMVRQGYITEAQAEEAKAEELHFTQQEFPIRAPHFVMYVRQLLEQRYGADALYRGGLQVTTSLDINMQEQAEQIARERVASLAAQNAHNAAIVAIDPHTGEILTMVGSVDFFDPNIGGQVNMALAERQPGSSFKPFTYLTAFMKGYTPATMLLDIPTTFPDGVNKPYTPKNVDGKFRGPVSIRVALSNSLNIPAVRTISYTGVQAVIDTAHKMGITGLTKEGTYGLSLTLGGGEVMPLDIIYAYSVFANGGVMAGTPVLPQDRRPGMRELDPVAILRVVDAHGEVLEEFKKPQTKQIISPQLAYLITSILSDNDSRALFFGPNSPLKLADRPAAAKTGTTDDWRDNWTIGYTPDLVAGVWVGNTDNKPMIQSFGSTAAAPIWNDFMMAALKDVPVTPFVEPPGLEKVEVCPISGKLATPFCPSKRTEIFIQGTAPKEPCDVHKLVRIDKTTGKLATPQTPPENVEEKVYEILPPEAAEWAREAGIEQPPTELSPVAPTATDLAIISPAPNGYISRVVNVIGTAAVDGLQRYQVEYGAGLSPQLWTQIGQPHTGKVTGGALEKWDTTGLNGLYTLRLRAVGKGNVEKEVRVPVTVDNIAPTVHLTFPTNGATLQLASGQAETVSIKAEAGDNLGIARVEFFVDDKSLGSATTAPYNRDWHLESGQHRLRAVAYDRAGNTAEAGVVTVTVK